MSNTFNTDFFSFLPKWMADKVQMKILLYKDEPWLADAVKEYGDIVKSVARRDIPDPDRFFEKYEIQHYTSIDEVDLAKEKFSDDDAGLIFSADEPLHIPTNEEMEDLFNETSEEIEKPHSNKNMLG